VSTAEEFAVSQAPQALRLALGSIPVPELRRVLTAVRSAVDADALR
jgi:hypothetical protein